MLFGEYLNMDRRLDLPLNRRDAVYHIDLRAEEIADTIITVGDPRRVARISKHFDSIEYRGEHREFVTHTGYIGKKRLTVISTGIGMPNIDIVMTELDALVNMDVQGRCAKKDLKSLTIMRLGTTGALLSDVVPGDILISDYAIGFDSLMHYYEPIEGMYSIQEAVKSHFIDMPNTVFAGRACPKLLEKLRSLGRVGITATCSGFYGPQGRIVRLPLQYPGWLDRLATFQYDGSTVTNLEMETAALLAFGQLLGHRCISVSVALGNRITHVFSQDVDALVEKFIQDAIGYIAHM